jgi:hypothetical protein
MSAIICRLHIDEVGNNDLSGAASDENVRYLSLTGVITKTASHSRTIQPHWNEFKVRVFGPSGTSLVLHRREIMRRERSFEILRDPKLKALFNAGLLHLVDTLPYLVNTATIDKREHLARYSTWRYDPYHYCLCCIVERYVLWMRRHGYTGDVAIEPRDKGLDKKIKASFRRFYDGGTDNLSPAIMQAHLSSHDIKFFPKQSNVAAMELCDLIAHPSYRSMKFERDGVTPPNDFGTAIAGILIGKKYSRDPTTMNIVGRGRKWLP